MDTCPNIETTGEQLFYTSLHIIVSCAQLLLCNLVIYHDFAGHLLNLLQTNAIIQLSGA